MSKCWTVGIRSSILRCNIFPKINCERIIDKAFRERTCVAHHQVYKNKVNGKVYKVPVIAPLLKLPFGMVQVVIVSDSLHLLHLGITKRLLEAYTDGHDGLPGCKLSKLDVEHMSKILIGTKLPVEFHRAQRETWSFNCVRLFAATTIKSCRCPELTSNYGNQGYLNSTNKGKSKEG